METDGVDVWAPNVIVPDGDVEENRINEIISHPNVDYVAAADVDTNYLKEIKSAHPDLKVYTDYRELLDKEKNIDCLNVSTPDHTHAIMAMSAMKRGIHIYCQKPMAHDLYEVRKLTQYAARHKIITQMCEPRLLRSCNPYRPH